LKEHPVLESYLHNTSVVQQQIDSYNRFITIGIRKIIENQSNIEPEISDFAIKLNNIRLGSPVIIESDSSAKRIMPNEALARNLTYSAPIYLTYTPVISGIEKTINTSEVFIGDLPVMVKSELCYTKSMARDELIREGEDPDDPGGYFIIKGSERVLVGIEDLAPNRIICTVEKKGVMSKVFSTTLSFRARCSITRDDYGIYSLLFPTVSKGVDLVLVLKALGMQPREALALVDDIKEIENDMLLNIDLSKARDLSKEDCVMELGRMSAPNQARAYQEKRAEMQLDTYILPHIGSSPENRKDKAEYLVRMAKRASMVAYGYARQEDKDHYANKRVKLAGDLMEELFSNAFKLFAKDIRYHVEKTAARGRKLNVRTNINPDALTDKILYAMGTGSWPAGQTGVSQVLDRTNFISALAHLRRVKSPLTKKHPHFKARDVHGTYIGKICPSETPEGIEVGLTKYLAIMSKVTVGAEQQGLEDKLKEHGLVKGK
jgi:DNA-directed RNA polymerase beta subunit